MISDVISEEEFKKELALWLLENDLSVILPYNESKEDFLSDFVLPEFDYIHTQSVGDKNGDLITLLKGEIHLKEWETKNGKEEKRLVFYKVMKTFSKSPDTEPYPIGYIIVR